MASSLKAVAGDRVQTRTWRGEGVKLQDVARRLSRIHAELEREHEGQQDHPHPRNCVLNLVVSTLDDPRRASLAEMVTEQLATAHPLRAILLLAESDGPANTVDAEITTQAHALVTGASVQREQILLRVHGEARNHLMSVIELLLVPDVPTYLWWAGTPPLGEGRLRESAGMCGVLILDSSRFERPFDSFLELARLAPEISHEARIADLQWGRLRPWRETIARCFSPGERRPFLQGINGVGIDYAGEGRGNRVAAAMLAGWLSSRLEWRLKRAAGGAGGLVQAFLETARSHPVEMSFRSVQADGLVEGEPAAVRLEGAAKGRTFALTVERLPGHRHHAEVRMVIGGVEMPTQRIPMTTPAEPDLLLTLISEGGLDPVYARALERGGELLSATR